ncbi:MAG: NADH-quinone oxidoreductase subunit M, partial [Planctomycetes bacterium]|nr:NADH-quinone oxidoreductase subunit M [Planctomycetota bacterium]
PTLLMLLLILPAAAAILVACLGPRRALLVRQITLGACVASLIVALVLAFGFLSTRTEMKEKTFRPEFVPGSTAEAPHATTWNLVDFNLGRERTAKAAPKLGAIQFYIGLDGMNIWLVVLTTILMVASVLISWNAIKDDDRAHEFHAWLLLLGFALVGVFLAFDIILFYVFFELTLVPLFFLIGIWGGPERRYAARKFFIYTLAGSVITFLGLLAVVVVCFNKTGQHILTFSIPELVTIFNDLLETDTANRAFYQSFQFWVFLAMMAGFAIKVPLVPVHTWLPLAHVEAPTAGSVLLAGVLLKMGTYGFMRLCLPLAPDASITVGVPIIGTLSVVGIIYGALCAKAQDDIKKLVAYSSVSHLGFCTLGMFALNSAGLTGSLLQMINHGLSTGALFLLVGMIYERYHTRAIGDYGGLGTKLKAITFCMVFISLSSVGLPGLNGFVGEALVFFGMFETRKFLAILGTAGIILGAWYLLTMLRQVFFGVLKEPPTEGHEVEDITPREIAALAPIMAVCLLLGVYPQPILDSVKPDIDVVANILKDRKAKMTAEARAQAE